MDAIETLREIDIISWIIIGFMILSAFVAGYEIIGKFSEIIGKPLKWVKNKNKDHELLMQTSQNLAQLQLKHELDFKQSNEQLTLFMDEIKNSLIATQNDMKQFAENRIRDREQSYKIQRELTDSIKVIADGEKDRNKQIEALMCGSKELLGAEIDARYARYISLDGIPESDVDEFDDIYKTYKGLLGNHKRDTKYNYVKNHLHVIPVETKLIINKETN